MNMKTRLAVLMTAVCAAACGVAKDKLIFFGAHPDDSEGYAGTAFLLAKDYEIHMVDLTHGELGLGYPGLKDGSTARRRTAEENAASAYLGAKIHFLDEVDGSACASEAAAEAFAKLLKEIRPRAVFAHWPVDEHPDHAQCAAILSRAKAKSGVDPEVYFFEVLLSQTRNWHPIYSVDITSTISNKIAMLRHYACQNVGDSLVKEKVAQARLRGKGRTPPVGYAETFTTFDGRPIPGGVLENLVFPGAGAFTPGARDVRPALSGLAAENRASIQKAIDEAAAKGGGRVVIPPGEWPCGSLELKSHVELHLVRGAVLKGSADSKDYNADDAFPENFHSVGEEWSGGHLVWARAAEDIAITGRGVIDGNGGAFFPEACQYQWGGLGYKYGIKLFPTDRTWFRPGPMIAFFLSKGIRIEDVTLANTPCWTCHIRCSDGVKIRGVTIDADRTIANSDGFSIDCTRNVEIEKCVVKTGDDGFAIRASCPHHAERNLCENIAVRDCEVWSCCFGARLGIGTGTIRNVRFENCNFYESAWGVGFTPAWVSVGRNVYIEDVIFRNCFVGDCERPVSTSMPNADAHVRNAVFEDCRFESHLPSGIWQTEKAPIDGLRFVRCDRKTVYEMKTLGRYFDQKRNQAEYRRKADLFLETNAQVGLQDVTPVRGEPKGVLILSFDDRNFAGWRNALPVFDKYGAHATFFVSGEIDNDVVRTMKLLRAHGHSVGLHGLRHADADAAVAKLGDFWKYYDADIAKQKRTCDVCYVPVTSFAYPNCRRTDETDKGFYQAGYERVRGGVKGAAPFDPQGVKQKDRKPLVTNEAVYFPAKDLPKRRLINTVIMGEAYHTDIDEICDCLRRVAKNREVISITSHDIGPNAKFINMKTEWLETLLKLAKELDLRVLGFDELPPPDPDAK